MSEIDEDVSDGYKMKSALNIAIRRILKHPQGVVCKHWMLAVVMSELEAVGFPQPDGFVRAVVRAEDDIALSYPDFFDPNGEPAPELDVSP